MCHSNKAIINTDREKNKEGAREQVGVGRQQQEKTSSNLPENKGERNVTLK